MTFLLNSQAQGVSGKMNNLPKHHGAEARAPMHLHRLAGPEYENYTFSKHSDDSVLACGAYVV